MDSIGPRLRQMLTAFQETSGNLKDMSDAIRPAVESTVGHVEDLSRRISASAPKIEATLARLEAITQQAELILGENRENVRSSLASVRGLTFSLNDVVAKDRVKVEKLLEGLDMTRAPGRSRALPGGASSPDRAFRSWPEAGPRSSDR